MTRPWKHTVARRAWLAWAPMFVLAGLGGCGKKSAAPPSSPPPTVTVTHPVRHDVIEWDEYTGQLEAVDSVDVRARVSGQIVATPFKEGAIVRKGDVLVELDARPFQATLDSMLAAQEQAAAQLSLAQITYDHTKAEREEESASVIEYQTAAAQLQAAKAALAHAKANVESARLNVQWCHVRAPISGRVSFRYVTAGNMVTGATGSGTLLTTITSIDPIYCYLNVDEGSVLKYQRLEKEKHREGTRNSGSPCLLQLADETGFPHEGVIDFTDNRVDPNTGTLRVRGVFENPDGWLTPGLFTRVRVPGSDRYSALLIPDAAIATNQSEKEVLVVNAKDVVVARAVQLGPLFGELRSIKSGIGPDDRVITNGLMHIRPGMQVQAKESPITSAMLRPDLLGLAATKTPATAPVTTSVAPPMIDPAAEAQDIGSIGPTSQPAGERAERRGAP